MSTTAKIHELLVPRLAGRAIDVVGFIDELLANEANEIRCQASSDRSLRFELGDESCEVDLDAARAKLRMLCARLSVLCKGTDGGPVSPYGGEGTIAVQGEQSKEWKLRFKNTPDEQAFELTHSAAIPLSGDMRPTEIVTAMSPG